MNYNPIFLCMKNYCQAKSITFTAPKNQDPNFVIFRAEQIEKFKKTDLDNWEVSINNQKYPLKISRNHCDTANLFNIYYLISKLNQNNSSLIQYQKQFNSQKNIPLSGGDFCSYEKIIDDSTSHIDKQYFKDNVFFYLGNDKKEYFYFLKANFSSSMFQTEIVIPYILRISRNIYKYILDQLNLTKPRYPIYQELDFIWPNQLKEVPEFVNIKPLNAPFPNTQSYSQFPQATGGKQKKKN